MLRSVLALVGTLIISIVVPCMLVWIRQDGRFTQTSYLPRGLEFLWFLFFYSAFTTGPITLIIGAAIYGRLRRRRLEFNDDDWKFVACGINSGVLASSLNVPGYFVIYLLSGNMLEVTAQLATLFILTGALCGGWLGWRVYRETAEQPKRFPSFSLKTCIVIVFSLAIVIYLFMPVK